MISILRIVKWSDRFECNRTRELTRLNWVPIPNKHDGDGYTELLDHPNGMAHYGAWMLIVQVASKCDTRGTLLRERSKPHDAASLARVSRGSKAVFEEAIPRLISIGWLEVISSESESSDDKVQHPATGCDPTASSREKVPIEGNRIEGKGIEHTPNARRAANFVPPATEAEAVEWAAASGVPPDFAKALYHQCEGRGWVDGAGQAIQMWSNYAKGRYLKEAFQKPPGVKNEGQQREQREHTVHELARIIEAKEKLCADLKRRYCSEVATGDSWSDQAKRSEYIAIRKEIKNLNEKIAKKA